MSILISKNSEDLFRLSINLFKKYLDILLINEESIFENKEIFIEIFSFCTNIVKKEYTKNKIKNTIGYSKKLAVYLYENYKSEYYMDIDLVKLLPYSLALDALLNNLRYNQSNDCQVIEFVLNKYKKLLKNKTIMMLMATRNKELILKYYKDPERFPSKRGESDGVRFRRSKDLPVITPKMKDIIEKNKFKDSDKIEEIKIGFPNNFSFDSLINSYKFIFLNKDIDDEYNPIGESYSVGSPFGGSFIDNYVGSESRSFRKLFDSQTYDEISIKNRKSLSSYTGGEYRIINDFLRLQRRYMKKRREDIMEKINNINTIFSFYPRLKDPIILKRCIRKEGGLLENFLNKKITERGFLSTSLIFLRNYCNVENTLFFVFAVPPGFPGIIIKSGLYEFEKEILLPNLTTYEVVAQKRVKFFEDCEEKVDVLFCKVISYVEYGNIKNVLKKSPISAKQYVF